MLSTLLHGARLTTSAASLARVAPYAAAVVARSLHAAASNATQPALATDRTADPAEQYPTPGNVELDASEYSSEYPASVWNALAASLFPHARRQQRQPVAVDLSLRAANAAAGRSGAALELARRGFNVLSVGTTSASTELSKTLLHASTNADSEVDVIAAQLEPAVVRDGAADLVTVMHGLHLLEVRPALLEAHRILKPGGKLVVAFNDRDLRCDFNDMLEEVAQAWHPRYNSATGLHAPAAWAPMLRQDGLFRLTQYLAQPGTPLVLHRSELSQLVGCQDGVRARLNAADRAQFDDDVAALAEWRFGTAPVVLNREARLYVLEKAVPRGLQ